MPTLRFEGLLMATAKAADGGAPPTHGEAIRNLEALGW